ncbi:hypothetical protein [Prauserella rugosa]|uniref:Lipoprotein n=1 Tax=Prauserella rugosa TaxID=43354 RepID=A0A660CG62_9PSEU|nr:hypothetical protein [Prauserella rugosa]KID28642.1 hypothetical protein HQ32_03988 [Prauserella sp. Am3]KMS87224.1 hypothetical protein ACZ91_32475 [Streptomyces regensis]TWH20509.1 hypothetical protein JD82_02355 [Prauserella rugosa]
MRKTALAAGAAALLLLAGCSGDDTASNGGGGGNGDGGSGVVGNLFGDANSLADAASQNTSEKKSAKFTMTMNMMGLQATAEGEGLYDGADSKQSMTMDMMGQKIDSIVVGDTMYMKMPQGMGGSADKPWMKQSLTAGDQSSQMMEYNDPSKMMEFIQKAGEITDSEETTVEGQQATHYKVALDFEKMAGELGGMAGGANAQEMAKKVGDLPMEVWLNDEQLPIKITMDLSEVMKQAAAEAGGNASGMSGDAKIEMTYSDWGTPVNIEEPPADQVGEMPTGAMPN